MKKVVLGIETSCDETSVAIIAYTKPPLDHIDPSAFWGVRVLSNIIVSQIEDHAMYGGVVPEIAARAHLTHIEPLLKGALQESGLGSWQALDCIAVTQGPGLVGGLIVGLMLAKGLSVTTNKPLVGINHLEGHILSVFIENPDITFPFLALLVSGGHTQLVRVNGVGSYDTLGYSVDDALGEAFDKVAKMLGLPYPGGPYIERLATRGDKTRFAFPCPMLHSKNAQMSFSGLKTAVRDCILSFTSPLVEQDKADICASFQETVKKILLKKVAMCLGNDAIKHVVIVGGVAANRFLFNALKQVVEKNNTRKVVAPSLRLCTDNAAMIANVAFMRWWWRSIRGGHHHDGDNIDDDIHGDYLRLSPKARWALS